MGVTVSYGEFVIRSIDWSSTRVLRGSGPELADALSQFVGCEEAEGMSDLWWGLEGVMFSQDTIYGAAEPAVDVLMAALADDRPQFVKAWILEALRFVVKGGSVEDPELPGRCRDRARRGVWLLVAVASELAMADRESVAEVLDLVEPAVASVVRDAPRAGEV